jgi:hypothetical protein
VLFATATPPVSAEDQGPGLWAYLLIILSIPPGALLAQNWLRVLLLGPGAVPGLGVRWGTRETRFLGRMIVIFLAGLLATLMLVAPALVVIGLVAGGVVAPQGLTVVSVVAALLIYAYISLRLSLALVAVALDLPGTLGQSWAATRGLGGPMVLAGIGVVGPFYVMAFLLPALLRASGLEAAAPLSSLLLQVMLAALTSAAGFALVAVIYRRLAGRRPGSV